MRYQGVFRTGLESRTSICIKSLAGPRHFDDYDNLINNIIRNFITFLTGRTSFPIKIAGRIISG